MICLEIRKDFGEMTDVGRNMYYSIDAEGFW